ncbi:MAG: hypothetical protein WD602_00435 [Actinomycetota bacterium]
MSPREHYSEYDEVTTARCERALVTLLGEIGPWSERIYLAGGLAPRYIVGELPEGARAHVGTTDIDVVIGLVLGDAAPETYRTLENNLKKAQFRAENSFRWKRDVDGVKVQVEFLCETNRVNPGHIFKPKGEGAGSGLGAFNVRGAQLVTQDYLEREIEAERLDDGGMSRVKVRVANLFSCTVLKIFAFQDRHENKDAYDLIFCLLHFGAGPDEAATEAVKSPIARREQVAEALTLLRERFADVAQDGPIGYASFLAEVGDDEATARLRRQAVATVEEFLARMGGK